MGESTAVTLASVLQNVGSFFTELIGWFGDIAQTIAQNPLLFIFLVAIPITGAVTGWVLRLIKGGRGRR